MSILRHRILLVVAGTAALAIWLPTGASAQDRELGAGGELLEGVAAVVDEGIVLKSELSERLALVMQTLEKRQAELPPEQRPPLPPMAVIEQQVLDQLILREIQLQRAERVGITVADDMLNEALVARRAESRLHARGAADGARRAEHRLCDLSRR